MRIIGSRENLSKMFRTGHISTLKQGGGIWDKVE